MKKLDEKSKKYIAIGVVVLMLAALVLIFVLANAASKDFKPKGKLSAKLEDSSITSNETTYLLVGVKNDGKEMLEAKIRVTPDDPQSVKISYEAPDLLNVRLLPGESVVRRLEVQGFSKAIRTDYELNVELIGKNESSVAKQKIILVVKKD